jgi:hypothetical protein
MQGYTTIPFSDTFSVIVNSRAQADFGNIPGRAQPVLSDASLGLKVIEFLTKSLLYGSEKVAKPFLVQSAATP